MSPKPASDPYAADAAYLIDHYYKAESVDIMLRDHTSCGVLEYGEDNPELSADIYVVAFDEGHSSPCSSELIETLELSGKRVFFMGTKHFGYNLNWITQIDRLARGSLCQDPQKDFLAIHLGDKRDIPSKNYVSIMDPLSKNGCIEVTTPEGELISSDRKHLTIAGVEHVATKVFDDSNIDKAVRNVLSTP